MIAALSGCPQRCAAVLIVQRVDVDPRTKPSFRVYVVCSACRLDVQMRSVYIGNVH